MTYTIVPNWNGERFLKNCLDSLSQQTEATEIVVVDNGSRDNSVDFIKTHYPGVKLIGLEKNYGFAGGVNAGIAYTLEQGADYIALFNNDAVADKDWLKNLIKTARNSKETGIVTGKILSFEEGIIDSTGDLYSIWGTPFPRGRGEKDRSQYDSDGQREVLAASGGASLYRAEMLRDVGLFDQKFFAYYEDVDISFRAQLAGWKVLYEPRAIVWHHIGGTSAGLGDFRLYHMYKNFLFLFIKNMPGRYLLFYGWRVFGVFGFKMLQLMKKLKFGLMIKIMFVVTINLPRIVFQRDYIQKNRRVSSKYIDSLLYHAPPPNQPALTKITQKLGIK